MSSLDELPNDSKKKVGEVLKKLVTYQITTSMPNCKPIIPKFSNDPTDGLSVYGIIKTVGLLEKYEDFFDSNMVIVSNSLHTWITAILLYGVKKQEKGRNDDLELYIAPSWSGSTKSWMTQVKNGLDAEIDEFLKQFCYSLDLITSILENYNYFKTSIADKVGGDLRLPEYEKNGWVMPVIVNLHLPLSEKTVVVIEKKNNKYCVTKNTRLNKDYDAKTYNTSLKTIKDEETFKDWLIDKRGLYHGLFNDIKKPFHLISELGSKDPLKMTLTTLKPNSNDLGQQIGEGIMSQPDDKIKGMEPISTDKIRIIEDKSLHLSYCNNKDRILSFKVLTLLKLERFIKNNDLTELDNKKAEQLFTAISNMRHL